MGKSKYGGTAYIEGCHYRDTMVFFPKPSFAMAQGVDTSPLTVVGCGCGYELWNVGNGLHNFRTPVYSGL